MTEKALKEHLVKQALGGIAGFSGARIEAQLSDGPTNVSYLMSQSAEHYVLRLDKPDAAKLGLNRSNEKRVCEVVAESGLAPESLYFDVGTGVYLRRFLPGRSWTVSDLASNENLERLARLLRELHSLPPAGARFEPLAAARRYAAQLACENSRSILDRAENLVQEMEVDSMEMVLCHNDLVCQNVLEGEQRLMLIDWEYAAIGDSYFDLAVVVRHHGLNKKSAHNFLNSYLDRSANTRELDRLQRQCDFYQCLLELWNLRTEP